VKTAADTYEHHRAMKTQECRWPERDRQAREPPWLNPKRTESCDEAIQGAQIRSTPARTIEDQQLVFGENGFCHDGSHATGSKDAHNRGDDVDKSDNQITHARF
jgi:hypothetical protein